MRSSRFHNPPLQGYYVRNDHFGEKNHFNMSHYGDLGEAAFVFRPVASLSTKGMLVQYGTSWKPLSENVDSALLKLFNHRAADIHGALHPRQRQFVQYPMDRPPILTMNPRPIHLPQVINRHNRHHHHHSYAMRRRAEASNISYLQRPRYPFHDPHIMKYRREMLLRDDRHGGHLRHVHPNENYRPGLRVSHHHHFFRGGGDFGVGDVGGSGGDVGGSGGDVGTSGGDSGGDGGGGVGGCDGGGE